MKVVIIGGTGLIGRKVAAKLQSGGHDVVAASPSTGVNSLTGEGLEEVLRGSNVVVDVTNSPSFEDDAVLDFFRTSTGHLLSAAAAAGVSHYVALSVVGSDRISDSGYLRAKRVQEGMIEAGGVPYTVLRATQFFEFLKAIADGGTEGNVVHMSPSKFQPVAADDVAATLAEIVTGQPRNGVVELGGPEASSMAEFIQRFLSSVGDERKVVPDADAKYFGAVLDKDGLAPAGQFIAGSIRLADWTRGLMLNPSSQRRVTVKKIALLLLVGASLLSTNATAEETNPPASKVTQIFDRELPNVPGKSMRAVLVEYGPGAGSPSHRHPSSAFIYATVLEGEILARSTTSPRMSTKQEKAGRRCPATTIR